MKQKQENFTESMTGKKYKLRPSDCTDVERANEERRRVISAISVNLAKINDVNLTHHQIRDINDTINRQLRLRRAWEHRIKELGGPDYILTGNSHEDKSLSCVVKGYRYFGRARELPDVVKLLEEATIEKSNKQNARDKEQSIVRFRNSQNWPADYPDLMVNRESKLHFESTAPSPFTFEATTERPVTENVRFMEKFLLQKKKALLLKKIRSK